MMELLGYPAMVLMGVVLGTLGAGGSILVMPILVYLFGVAPTMATGYSLVIVGTTAVVGAIEYLRRGQSNPRMALVFGSPAIVAVYLTRRYFFPAIPDPVIDAGAFTLGKDAAVMILFSVFMLAAAGSMMRSGRGEPEEPQPPRKLNIPLIMTAGFVVGVFTGLVGAGGGFIILPVLVLLGGLPMKVAVGTDLLIIAAKSLVGFVGEVQAVEGIDFAFVGMIALLPIVGMGLGTYLNKRAPARLLRTSFAWFVLIMGGYIVLRELLAM